MPSPGRLHFPSAVALAVLLACTVGCKAELSADLKVDGNTFGPTSCRSGEPNGFAGVDLIDDGGAILRIVQTPTMQPHAILIIGQEIVDLGPCGTLSLDRQNSMVNDITNVMGNATLKCSEKGHSVEGTVSFKNCH